jgi:4a-hydroxytetrahydrobiopterin dehydratase
LRIRLKSGTAMKTMTIEDLRAQDCIPRKGKENGVAADEAARLLALLPGWSLDATTGGIRKTFRFADYFLTIGFVNAVASIAHREDHHPELDVAYDRCSVHYSTHDVGGLSLNDFICAAKVEGILPRG